MCAHLKMAERRSEPRCNRHSLEGRSQTDLAAEIRMTPSLYPLCLRFDSSLLSSPLSLTRIFSVSVYPSVSFSQSLLIHIPHPHIHPTYLLISSFQVELIHSDFCLLHFILSLPHPTPHPHPFPLRISITPSHNYCTTRNDCMKKKSPYPHKSLSRARDCLTQHRSKWPSNH